MAIINSSKLYSPEVWSEIATREFVGKAIVATSPAVLSSDQLSGQPGDTIDFPKWGLLAEMADIAEDDSLVPETLTQSNSKATIKEAGKAVEFTDKAALTGIGNIQDEALRQFGILAARKVDSDLIAAASATVTGGVTYADGSTATDSKPFVLTATGGLTWANIVSAMLLFGDDYDPADFAGLFINSAQAAAMFTDPQFISAAQTSGGNTLVSGGVLGTLGGLRIFLTNRLTSGKALLLKNNSLGLFYKRRPVVEQDRDILARTTVIATNLHYAVKRVNDQGVVDITIPAGA